MFKIIQSNDTGQLAERLTKFYQRETNNIFEEFVVIVPAKVLEEWLKKTIAKQLGISSLFASQFWGQYQWQLIARVLEADALYLNELGQGERALKVPETATLGASVIRWRLFAYLFDPKLWQQIADNETHVLHTLLFALMDDEQKIDAGELWRFCDGLARLYVGYLTERTDWLDAWARGKSVNVDVLIAQKDRVAKLYGDDEYLAKMAQNKPTNEVMNEPNEPVNAPSPNDDNTKPDTPDENKTQTPEWLKIEYKALERALAFLWQPFKRVYQHRMLLEQRFWQVLDDKTHPVFAQKHKLLPKTLYLFTVQQLPQIELDFLKRLSTHTDVVLLHFNPSAMFWADIVDKNWLLTQKVINPERVYLKDYGHTLLSRLGKSSRETFAMLAELSGGETGDVFVDWVDIFDESLANTQPKTLLDHLKADILMLNETPVATQSIKQKTPAQFVFDENDDSLVIHNCHSLKRELEIARLLIGKWLNEKDTRRLSDIAIMLPDVQSNGELIASVFGQGVGMDGLSLPAKITGVMDESTHKLWAGILGVYRLPAGRLYFDEFCEWLMNDYVYQAFGLSFEMARRACELLSQAGFVRGLDEMHLKQSLHEKDTDFRRTLAFAIDRLSLALTMNGVGVSDVLYPFVWQGNFAEKTHLVAGVSLDDGAIVQALARIYLALKGQFGKYEQKFSLVNALVAIEKDVIGGYFYQFHSTQNLKSIFDAMNAMKASVRANKNSLFDKTVKDGDGEIFLPLRFVLDALSDAILAQQVAAEPSGVITFGRFGSLRGIGFGLVIMLGMNLSEFPRTEPINRLDLKKAGLPRRGDRVGEDDDNGAFLEAILQAKENCWIFFSGQKDDGKKTLPATPVNELINFFKNVEWQGTSFDKIEPQLVRLHTPTPFHQDNFIKDTALPSPRLWQTVYKTLTKDRQRPDVVIDLPTFDDVKAFVARLDAPMPSLSDVSINKVITAIKKPARAYLSDKLHIAKDDEKDVNEPLSLSGLDNHKLNQLTRQLLHQGDDDKIAELAYDTLLPAGVARQTAITQKTQEMSDIFGHYDNVLTKLGIDKAQIKTSNQLISLPLAHLSLSINAPLPKDVIIWHTLKIESFSNDKAVECYLWHLCWQIKLHKTSLTTESQTPILPYSSVWCFYKNKNDEPMLLSFNPLVYDDAVNELKKWLVFYELIKENPICLTPDSAIAYLSNQEKMQDGINAEFFQEWLKKPYEFMPSSNSHHPDWQMVLGDGDALGALMAVLPLAEPVYGGFYKNSKQITVEE